MTKITATSFQLPEVKAAFGRSGSGFDLGQSKGPSFGQMVTQSLQDTVETIRAGDRAALAGLQGTMPLQDVVQATIEMETAMQTTVTLRDKALNAWQELLRMSV